MLLLMSPTSQNLVVDTLSDQMKMENTPGFIDDCFFVTERGYFGRAPADAVKPGLFIAILGGAWVPYLLEQHDDYFSLVCHSYVEGIMSMRGLGPTSRVETLKLR
jgi:hypothetical protein